MGNKVLKGLIFNIKKNKRNVFSSTSGLKGYKVGKKRFPPTVDGFERATRELSILGVGGRMEYLY